MCNFCDCGFQELADHEIKAEEKPAIPVSGFAALRDQIKRAKSTTVSAGRKELSRNVELEDGKACEWAGLKRAGGGVRPITGCRPEEEMHEECKHHGPDKSTLNNEPDNYHRICVRCHNRWHQLNDMYYGIRPVDNSTFLPKEGVLIPHDPLTKATEEDFLKEEEYWKNRRLFKAKKEPE